MQVPSLKLLILQGPRQGETLESRPGTAIRVGRVARGNTLSIKDAGISSKHLSILTESGKWMLRDLHSSNGTVLDDSEIPPHTPIPLYNGATIKIGELTSFRVILLQPGPTEPVQKPDRGKRSKGLASRCVVRVTRNSKNRVAVSDSNQEKVEEELENIRNSKKEKDDKSAIEVSDWSIGNLDAPVEDPNKCKQVTRTSKNRVGTSDLNREKVEEELKNAPNSKNERSVVEISDLSIGNSDAPVEDPKNCKRVTRNSKKRVAFSDSNQGEVEEELKNARNSKNERSVVEVSNWNIRNSDAPAEDSNNWKRVTRHSKKKGSQNLSLECGVQNVEAKKTRVGGKRRKLQEESVDGGVGEKGNLNLEKLSLGEWFDFLEAYLPKQIIDETEEIIDSMRQKAEKLREYIIMN